MPTLTRKASTAVPRDSAPPASQQRRTAASSQLASTPEEDTDLAGAVQADVQEQLEQLAEQVAALQADNTQLRQIVADDRERAAAQHAAMADTVKGLEMQLESVQRTMRSQNILVQGLPEIPGVTPEQALVRACADAGLAEPPAFSSASRVGKPREAPNSRPRPLLVKFYSTAAKHQLFARSKQLRDRAVYLDDDLTRAQQATRRDLMGAYLSIKEAGKKPYWRQEKLFYRQGRVLVQHHPGDALPSAGSPARAPQRGRSPVPQRTPASRLPGPPPRRSRSPGGPSAGAGASAHAPAPAPAAGPAPGPASAAASASAPSGPSLGQA